MKKIALTFIGLIAISLSEAQDIGDALRYATDDIQGTARFRAMSGAFGALGGDMSAVNINPAGSAIFNQSHASISLGIFDIQRDVNYFNTINSSSNTTVDLNQLGAAFVLKNVNPNAKWKGFSLGIAYDRIADYDEDWLASGVNPNNTIGNYFLAFADGRPLDNISALPGETISEAYAAVGALPDGFGNQQAFLGFEGFIFDPGIQDGDYISNVQGSNFNQAYSYVSRGYNGKLAFNFASNYDDKLYLGVNLNAHFINYSRSTFLRESNSNPSSTIRDIEFGNDLFVTGSGFSVQLGAIAKLTEELRIGLSYNTPTWFRISEETSQFLASTREENGGLESAFVNPNVLNVFPEYRFQSPGRLTGSLAYVFGRKGLISFDYSYRDFSNIEFRPSSDVFFSSLNNQINSTLDSSISYRIGGEYRINRISLRGGYRFEESPYQDDSFFGDLTGYSAGIGYNLGNMSIDLAFSHSQREIGYQLYSVGLTDSALLDSTFNDVILSLAFSL